MQMKKHKNKKQKTKQNKTKQNKNQHIVIVESKLNHNIKSNKTNCAYFLQGFS
jgi:hypothetical protein